FFSSRRRHTRSLRDWSSDVCSSDLVLGGELHVRAYCEDVEFSPEDASRTDFDYMCDVLSAVIEAGARTINIPDTVGYAIPREWRSEERRVGKECRSRWATYREKKKE